MLRQDLEAHRYGRKLRHRRMSSRANELNSAEWEKQIMKRVLVPLTGRPPDRRALATAFQVADHCHGLVDALSITPHAAVHTPAESTSIPSALLTQLNRIASEEQARVTAAARQAFEEFCRRHSREAAEGTGTSAPDQMSCWWREETGSPGDIIPEEARLADLVVMAQDETVADLGAPGIEAVLFGSGRALLLAPKAEPTSVGTTVAIAWDGGRAASRAVAAAMPLLSQAGRVLILSGDHPALGRASDPNRLAESLACHGISAVSHNVTAGGQHMSKVLMRSAVELGCDMLVMGAYGHSRFREMVLGGVTRGVLDAPADLPILMAH
jgi:nucleotide-binding universal stress UspA family protein